MKLEQSYKSGIDQKKLNRIKKENLSWSDIINLIDIPYHDKKTHIISICQNKGGVGKTTTTLNLGYLFSKIGKTLLIDLDTQGNLSDTFNIEYESFLVDFFNDKKVTPKQINDSLSIIPNNIEFDIWKRNTPQRNTSYKLKKILKDIKTEFDYILIDCPPSLDISFDLAIYASEYVMILMDGQPYALSGLENILSEIKKIKDDDVTDDFKIKNLGIVFNKIEKSTLINQIVNVTKEDYEVFNTLIRKNIDIPESQAVKQSIFEYNEECNASFDYFNLFHEVVRKIHG